MAAFPVPANEPERVAALRAYQILDTAPEVEFDVTTRVASHLFNAPIALVALMDKDRLWFKSRHGLAVEQLEREIAFCAHAIMRPEQLMVIEDLRADPRFADNPLVRGGPGIRFYAGAPLCDAGGHALGTIAVLATEPRSFGAVQRELLRDLAVSVMTAIDSRHRALELKRLATTDHLTGVANRIQFESQLSVELRQAQRDKQPVSVLYLDLDDFKAVNDRLGHSAGDTVLREVARRLQDQLRAGDTLARLGGDEFAIVMRGGADVGAATALAARIGDALEAPIELAGRAPVQVGVSIGITSEDPGPASASALLEQADHALYRAKRHATQRWSVFDGVARGRLSPAAPTEGAESSARSSLLRDDTAPPPAFSMAFQPIVSVSGRRVFAYEALVRGVASEPAAQVLARVTARDREAFDRSCRRTAIDLAARLGIVGRGACLSINCMPRAMADAEAGVLATLAAARRAQLPPDRVIFEVGEDGEVAGAQQLARLFRACRDHGFKSAIGDFGAGRWALDPLAQLQPNIVKVERHLVQDIDSNPARRAVVRGVLSVCRDLGITPIALGVETPAEYRALRDLGFDLFQGFLFAHPTFEALPEPAFPG
jgi:diguanylate cyclase (GGDEF)-like protein